MDDREALKADLQAVTDLIHALADREDDSSEELRELLKRQKELKEQVAAAART